MHGNTTERTGVLSAVGEILPESQQVQRKLDCRRWQVYHAAERTHRAKGTVSQRCLLFVRYGQTVLYEQMVIRSGNIIVTLILDFSRDHLHAMQGRFNVSNITP